MSGRVRFVCVLHSHQPVGNFDHVMEEAYRNSYLPYVQAFAEFPELALTHHYSGCLLEWLEQRHPEYLELLAARSRPDAQARRSWAFLGSGFYEPIMTMLPERDALGQLRRMADYLERKFGVRPQGAWLTERVWEPGLVRKLADAGVSYTVLDDSHFKAAGLTDEQLTGGFLTEDEGRLLTVYPGLERLRYLIPFSPVHEVVRYLRGLVPPSGERVVCYADDGEKFGVWPHTYQTCYVEGWLRNFLQALRQAQQEGWLVTATLDETQAQVQPVGKVYLPENSYREMTEWALPARRLAEYQRTLKEVGKDSRVQKLLPMLRGGNWRSFRAKYTECGQLYAKMMEISAKVEALPRTAPGWAQALTHLYRGQCNCPYWHGVFGGLYLPHLRSAIYRELIRAERLADEAAGLSGEVLCRDFDFDGEEEHKLANRHLALYLHPGRGGHLYELDLRDNEFNVGDTFSRRFEAYHEQVAQAVVPGQGGGTGGSIHEQVIAKERGLERMLQYDQYLRESLVDHLSPRALVTADLLGGNPPSDPGIRQGAYEVDLEGTTAASRKKNGARGKVRKISLFREGVFDGRAVEIQKEVILEEGPQYQVQYHVINRSDRLLEAWFALEMNYNLLAGDAPDRYYYHSGSANAGKLALEADFGMLSYVGLKDHWLNVALTLRPSIPAQVLVAPVRTVSQSEGGFESVYQSSSVLLQWPLRLEPGTALAFVLRQECGHA